MFTRQSQRLVAWLFLGVACLTIPFCFSGIRILSGFYASGRAIGVENCRIYINNQSSETIRITPIAGISDAVQIYQTGWPGFPAFQQRNITVKSSEALWLYYDCTAHHGVSQIYACNLGGKCYIHNEFVPVVRQDNGIPHEFKGFTFTSLESLSRPNINLDTFVKAFPEHDYSGLKTMSLCFIPVLAGLAGLYLLMSIERPFKQASLFP